MSLNNIDHVVVLMLENRSFDSLLGWAYEGKDKPALFIPNTPDAAYRGLQSADPSKFVNSALNGSLQVKPTRGANGFTVPDFDPGEEFAHVAWQFSGKQNPGLDYPINMLGVLADFAEILLKERKLTEADVRRVAGRVMQSYTPAQLPVLNQLARHYAVSDAWYASVPSQTNPNRSFLMCGTSMGMVNNGDLETNKQARDLERVLGMAIGDDRVDATTIFNALNDAGHDWRVFWQTSYLPQKMSNLISALPYLIPILAPISPLLAAAAGALLIALKPFTDYLNDLCSADLKSCYTWRLFPHIKDKIPNAASHFSKMDEFHRLARAGQLPKFSYIEPFWSISRSTTDNGLEALMSALGNDYHPPSNLLVGEAFVKEVYTSLISNRAAWNRTLLLITFDEFVGVFDHETVGPATKVKAPWDGGTPPPFKSPTGFKFDRLGARVPTIIVSPLVQKGTVFRSENGVPYDHTSVIASTLKWLGKSDKLKDFGKRTLAAPTFENVVTLDKPRSDAAALPFLDTQRFAGDPVGYGESFVLKSQGGPYVSSFYPTLKAGGGGSVISEAVMGMCIDLGIGANFPTYGGDKARLSFVVTAPDPAGQIAHNSTALLVSREPGLWARNTLGKWKDSPDCYYDNEYLDGDHLAQQTWTIQKLDNTGQPLRYGDRIYLVNAYDSGKRLTRDTRWNALGSWLTTDANGEYWTIEPAEARVASDGSWQRAPALKVIAASQQGGSRAQQLWGVDDAGQLRSIYQEHPGGPWSGWSGPWHGDSPAGLTSLAACQQNDGRVQLWGLDANHALYSIYQTSPGGGWSGWSGAGWNSAPPLKVIAASQQGGTRGAQLWGVDLNGQLRSTYQETAGGSWSGWSGVWRNAPGNLVSVAVCQQNNGTCRIWIVDGDGKLYSTRQTTPGGDWETWSAGSWGNPPPLGVIACSQQGGTRGSEIWAVDRQGVLRSNYAENNQINSPWSGWSGDWYGGSPRNLVSLAACQQNDGTVRLWGVDADGVLYSRAQTSPGGDWNAWSPSP